MSRNLVLKNMTLENKIGVNVTHEVILKPNRIKPGNQDSMKAKSGFNAKTSLTNAFLKKLKPKISMKDINAILLEGMGMRVVGQIGMSKDINVDEFADFIIELK